MSESFLAPCAGFILLSFFKQIFSSLYPFNFQARDLRQLRGIPEEEATPGIKWARRFLRKDGRFKLNHGKYMNKARLDASTKANICPFFEKLKIYMEKKDYREGLIFNFDETSLLKKKFARPLFIVEVTDQCVGNEEERCPITGCTAGLTVCANGTHLPSALILKKCYPEECYIDYDSVDLKIYRSEKGFITRTIFQEHMRNVILPAIGERQRLFARGDTILPALLILDGHSSRISPTLWDECVEAKIDLCILPAHTSHLLQPLDLGVNARFKSALNDLHRLPLKRSLGKEMHTWLREIEDALEEACQRRTVRHGFEVSGVYPFNPSTVTDLLPKGDKPIIRMMRNQLPISGEIVTDREFLRKWEEKIESRREEKEILNKKKKKESFDGGLSESVRSHSKESENSEEKEQERSLPTGKKDKKETIKKHTHAGEMFTLKAEKKKHQRKSLSAKRESEEESSPTRHPEMYDTPSSDSADYETVATTTHESDVDSSLRQF
jgi:hypothetical protein